MTSPPPPGQPSQQAGAVDWRVVRSSGPAGDFHARDPDPDDGHQLWIHSTPGPALILGSTQPDELIDRDRAADDGIEVCRRRSGGGLVHLDPATDCWLDAIVPARSPLWEHDVGLAFHWVGQLWAAALDEVLGPTGPALVNRPSPRPTPTSRPLWCFAEIGHGEITVGASKVVGLSQRRTREWVRLQSLVLGAWPGRRLLPYLDRTVAIGLVGVDTGLAGRGDGRAETIPEAIDPAAVRAGPPPGIRLPDPETLADAFIDHARRDRAGRDSTGSS